MSDIKRLAEEVDALTRQNEALRKALNALACEVDGMRAFEPEVRAAISNTNWACLRHHVDAARAALKETP